MMDGQRKEGDITLFNADDFVGLRAAGKLAAETLDMITPHVVAGITTGELDRICHEFMVQNGSIPASLNYRGYPKSCCISLNHVVCHGIPGDRVLVDGDILNIDVTVILDGWYGDTSRMYAVGTPNVKARRLMEITYQSLMKAIEVVKPGAHLGDIGHAIQTLAESNRLSVVRDFCGHGIGRIFHGPPSVMHFGKRGDGLTLKPGMVFTIEPMLNAGKADVKILSDGWTAVTRDRSLSAQFEHMLGVTEDGCEVFTISPAGLHQPPYTL